LSVSKVLDPPKSPLRRGTLIPVPPFLRGVRGDLKVPKVTAKHFSNNLLAKNKKCVGWVEERNPTFYGVCWVSLRLNPTYKYSKPTEPYWSIPFQREGE
jgi:hypothetical protein